MNLQREGDWIIYKTEDNRTFYYNDKSNQFQWTSPFDDDEQKEDVVVVNDDNANLLNEPNEGAYTQDDTVQAYSEAVDQVLLDKVDLPDYILASDWRPYVDQDSGVTYWYNYKTEESQWSSPFEDVAQVQTEGDPESKQVEDDAVDPKPIEESARTTADPVENAVTSTESETDKVGVEAVEAQAQSVSDPPAADSVSQEVSEGISDTKQAEVEVVQEATS